MKTFRNERLKLFDTKWYKEITSRFLCDGWLYCINNTLYDILIFLKYFLKFEYNLIFWHTATGRNISDSGK